MSRKKETVRVTVLFDGDTVFDVECITATAKLLRGRTERTVWPCDEEDKRVEFRDKFELSAMCQGDGELIGGTCVSG